MSYVILTASNMKKTINGNTFLGKCVTAYDLEENRIVRFVKTHSGLLLNRPIATDFLLSMLLIFKSDEKCL